MTKRASVPLYVFKKQLNFAYKRKKNALFAPLEQLKKFESDTLWVHHSIPA